MEKEDLEAIAQVLRGTNIVVLVRRDLRRADLWPAAPCVHCQLPGMAERTVVVNGFSRPMP